MALRVTQLHSTTSFLLPLSSTKLHFNRFRRPFCNPSSSMSTESSTQLTHTITLPGQRVEIVAAPGITPSEFRNAIDSSLFQQWLKNLQGENGALTNGVMSLNKVLIQGVDYFGKRVGFLKFKADVIDKEMGKKVPGIVFARGPAVAILILLESEGETYAVLTEQVRVPTGRFVLELPAGMLDDDKGDFVGTAVREVEEETGINLNKEDMVELTAFLDPSTGGKVFPSPGGCDEELNVFLCRRQVGKEIIQQLQGKKTGLQDHGEIIKVHVVPYAQLWRLTADAKVLMAIALYEMAKRDGLLSNS
ncbi:nudix hydrolase 14, chloroplastic-like [Chenopodium quinoa]|uniref:nudix hydrolase 14, chloroplastic-like n=1 Tax=Chenopodium quinoa TaxID=63459 RepID=UPI000B797DDD|nr:nudix hydrolase 14, chloroplastic-like [Chenopodium quinoa]